MNGERGRGRKRKNRWRKRREEKQWLEKEEGVGREETDGERGRDGRRRNNRFIPMRTKLIIFKNRDRDTLTGESDK